MSLRASRRRREAEGSKEDGFRKKEKKLKGDKETMDDDNFIDDTGVDPADRYGSDNEGFIGDAPQLETGHETRESLDILFGKAVSYNPQAEVLWLRGAKEKCLAVRLTPLERSLGKRIRHYKFERRFCLLLQFKANQGMVVEEREREDAVKSMVYEARGRLRDPVHASAGVVFHLQKHVQDLLEQLELTRASILESNGQINQLMSSLKNVQYHDHQPKSTIFENGNIVLDDTILGSNLIEFPEECSWDL
ncbi:hypothetical protein Syun_019778 [Stephania yunnanensis]|uniref:LOB domain-containing protein n=1 Tax=Stephania yunnanensis TaxID=152371 RepID=A0AAP0IX47_9MAGN